MNAAAYIIVTGMVQGVGFRWFVEREATKMGLKGWVKNLYDGNVEIKVEGEQNLIKELIRIVHIGNVSSRVTGIDIKWIEYTGKFASFTIRF